MSTNIPVNDLDRAIMALPRSRANTPEFYRQLLQGELWFLMKYHPELEGERMAITNGSPIPFIQITDKQGDVVPIFSSLERAEEGLQAGQVPENTYLPSAMQARELLELLGHLKWRAVVNPGCTTGSINIPYELMRDLANGTALKPLAVNREDEPQHVKLQILDPADYPTNLIQPVFEAARRYPNFKALWVFGAVGELPAGAKRIYHLMVLMEPRDEVIFHELNMVQADAGRAFDVRLALLRETDREYIANCFKQAAPFYVATGYCPPTVGKND